MSEELENAKKSLMLELNVQYKNLVSFLKSLPVGEQFKSFAFLNLDQGMFWIQKGIELLNVEQPKAEDIARQEPVEEAKTDSCT